jgi:DeoR family transcriptional regulator of aga operon
VHQPERLGLILERVSGNGTVTVAQLARDLGVSAASIRRDLELLDGQGLITRTHGGAVSRGVLFELPLRYKTARNRDQKLRIARAAAERVVEGSAVGLTGGTTATEVARALANRAELTVVTNALNIASELAVRPNLTLVVPGGVARSKSYELVGPMAETGLNGLNLDIAFVGVDGVSAGAGLTTHQEAEAHANRMLIQRSRRIVVVADSSKLGRVMFARICGVERVDELITDDGAAPAAIMELEQAGVTVTTV